MIYYPVARVRAHLAYFTEVRKAAKGTSEYNDLDTTVRLIEQLVFVMEQQEPAAENRKKKSLTDAAEKGVS